MSDHSLQAQLQLLTEHWTGLQAAVAQREQEIQQMDRRRAQLTEEILRNQGAMAYNKMLANDVAKRIADAEVAAAPAEGASPP